MKEAEEMNIQWSLTLAPEIMIASARVGAQGAMVATGVGNDDAMMAVIEDLDPLQLVVATMIMIATETEIEVNAVGRGVMSVDADVSCPAW